jgi:hypothetical protein
MFLKAYTNLQGPFKEFLITPLLKEILKDEKFFSQDEDTQAHILTGHFGEGYYSTQ